jgi:amidase
MPQIGVDVDRDELTHAPAFRIAQAIRSREHTAVEVLEAHLERIDRVNPKLNAIVNLDAEGARRRAEEADRAIEEGKPWGPLHGVPITIKDTTSSFPPLKDYVPAEDAPVVARLRAAGAVILGKTNMPELAADVQSNSPIFGPARNPWDLRRTPGGSTGGGAAAVAAGLSAMELGSDIGGSIRVPSHFCGIFGLKPTEHLVPGTGHIPDLPGGTKGVHHMNTFGPLARSIDDLEMALRILAGPDGRDSHVPPIALRNGEARAAGPRRFAWVDAFGDLRADQATREALGRLVDSLGRKGHITREQFPANFDLELAWKTYGVILGTESAVWLPWGHRLKIAFFYQFAQPNDPMSHFIGKAHTLRLRPYMRAQAQREQLIRSLEEFFGEWDAFLCPVCATPAFELRPSPGLLPGEPIRVDGRSYPYWVANTGFTAIFNLTGNPVVVVPTGISPQGLPIGVQVVGRRWGDLKLLAIAREVATAIGSIPRPPEH